MPIKVKCACGAAFAAKDELAGKTVKCPKCKKPLKIGAAAGTPTKAPAASKQPPAAKSAPPAKPVKVKPLPAEDAAVLPVTSTESLFDEIGLQAAAAGTRPCPGCTAPMPVEAIICVKCGYNARIGRRMETVKMGGDGEGGHGSVAADLMARAARVIDEDAVEDKKKTAEGLPWYVYLIGLAALVGFLAMMLLLPQRTALIAGGATVLGLAAIVNIYAVIRIWIVAFKEGIAHGLGCLLCSPYLLVFCIMHWDQCGVYLLTSIGCSVVSALVQVGMGYLPVEKAPENALVVPPPAAIARWDGEPYHLLRKVS